MKIKRLLTLMLSVSMLVTSVVPTYAMTEETNLETTQETEETKIEVSSAGMASITVKKDIEMKKQKARQAFCFLLNQNLYYQSAEKVPSAISAKERPME